MHSGQQYFDLWEVWNHGKVIHSILTCAWFETMEEWSSILTCAWLGTKAVVYIIFFSAGRRYV